MADMQLFSLTSHVKRLEPKTAAIEGELQTLIEKNMQQLFGVTFLKREFTIKNGRMDSVGLTENNCPVIFEYKRNQNEQVVTQSLFYLDLLLSHKANFQLLVSDKLGQQRAQQIDWSMPCVICLASEFTCRDPGAVNQTGKNIRLVKYKFYEGDLLLLEHVNVPQIPPTRPRRKNVPDFLEQYANASPPLQLIYQSIKEFLLSLGHDVIESPLKHYGAFKKLKNIVCVEFCRQYIHLYLRLDPTTVSLQEGFIEDVRHKGHQGTGHLRLTLKDLQDFEASKPLLRRVYHEN